MNIILWVILGALAGWIASMVMGTNNRQGILLDVVVGIIGAFAGGLIMNLFGAPGVDGFNLYSIVVSVLGAVVLLGIVKAFRRV